VVVTQLTAFIARIPLSW